MMMGLPTVGGSLAGLSFRIARWTAFPALAACLSGGVGFGTGRNSLSPSDAIRSGGMRQLDLALFAQGRLRAVRWLHALGFIKRGLQMPTCLR